MQLQLVSAFGLVVLVGLAWVFSRDRRRFPWRTVWSGLALQFVIALIILRTPYGKAFFDRVQGVFTLLIQCAGQGAEMVFGPLAREALRLLDGGVGFDLILCDLMMPEMDGVDLHARLAARAPEQVARMVFLTGGAFSPRARRFLDEVPNPRVPKPFDGPALRGLVRELLG